MPDPQPTQNKVAIEINGKFIYASPKTMSVFLSEAHTDALMPRKSTGSFLPTDLVFA